MGKSNRNQYSVDKGANSDVSQVDEDTKENMSVEVNPIEAYQCEVGEVETSVKRTAPLGPESIHLLNIEQLIRVE